MDDEEPIHRVNPVAMVSNLFLGVFCFISNNHSSTKVFAVKGFLTYTLAVEQEEVKPQAKGKAPETRQELTAFAFDVGMSIAIPLALFAFGGRTLDKYYGTSPKLLVLGLLLSLISTTIIIWKKVKTFL